MRADICLYLLFVDFGEEGLGPTQTFAEAPFAAPGRWSYLSGLPSFNIAENWSPDLLESLPFRCQWPAKVGGYFSISSKCLFPLASAMPRER